MTTRFLANENFPFRLVGWLRHEGHDVIHAAIECSAAADKDVIKLAQAEERVLLTFDRDYGELVFRSRESVPGVVLFRMGEFPTQLMHQFLRDFFEAAPALVGYFTVVHPGYYRQTPLPRDEGAGNAP